MPQVLEAAEPPKTTTRPTLETRLAFERAYIHGKGSVEALCERFSVAEGTAWEWYYKSSLKQKRYDYFERARIAINPPEPEPQLTIVAPIVNGNAKVQMVEEEIERLSLQLKTALKPSERASLVSSLDKLLEYVLPKSGRTKSRSKPDRRSPSVTDSPEQVASPEQAKPPVPIIASYSVEELQEALRLKMATVTDTVTDTVTPPLTSVTESNQTDLLRRTENGQ